MHCQKSLKSPLFEKLILTDLDQILQIKAPLLDIYLLKILMQGLTFAIHFIRGQSLKPELVVVIV